MYQQAGVAKRVSGNQERFEIYAIEYVDATAPAAAADVDIDVGDDDVVEAVVVKVDDQVVAAEAVVTAGHEVEGAVVAPGRASEDVRTGVDAVAVRAVVADHHIRSPVTVQVARAGVVGRPGLEVVEDVEEQSTATATSYDTPADNTLEDIEYSPTSKPKGPPTPCHFKVLTAAIWTMFFLFVVGMFVALVFGVRGDKAEQFQLPPPTTTASVP